MNPDFIAIKKKFLEIEKEYSALEEKNKKAGKGVVWDTEKGIFGTAKCLSLFNFFRRLNCRIIKAFLTWEAETEGLF